MEGTFSSASYPTKLPLLGPPYKVVGRDLLVCKLPPAAAPGERPLNFMCTPPFVVVLLELERAKNGLESENAALKQKLVDVQSQLVATTKQRDVLAGQRTDLSSQLQTLQAQDGERQSQLASFQSRLQASTQASMQYLAARTEAAAASEADATKSLAKRAADVVVLQADCVQGGAPAALAPEDGSTAKPLASPRGQTDEISAEQKPVEVAMGANATSAAGNGSPRSVAEAMAGVADAQETLLTHLAAMQAALKQSDEDRRALHSDFTRIRKKLETAEAAAAEQRRVLQMQCEALQQENSQLTGGAGRKLNGRLLPEFCFCGWPKQLRVTCDLTIDVNCRDEPGGEGPAGHCSVSDVLAMTRRCLRFIGNGHYRGVGEMGGAWVGIKRALNAWQSGFGLSNHIAALGNSHASHILMRLYGAACYCARSGELSNGKKTWNADAAQVGCA